MGFDPLRVRLPWGTQLSDENPDIAILTPDDLRDMRLPWLSRFSVETLALHLQANPGLSLWVPRTGEYVVAERWRRRDDISHVVEVTARKGKAALVRTLTERCRENGSRLVILAEEVWNEQTKLYVGLGFGLIEKIVFFQKDLKNRDLGDTSRLPVMTYRIPDQSDLDLIIDLDHNSFPWLWWNSREDMAAYLQTDGVSVYIAESAGEPVGYASFTMYNGWAHLDRLAVIEAQQGRKYGAAQLGHVLQVMVESGAGHVGLSTQENNLQSHRLYKSFGFRQTRDTMGIYGKE